MAGKRRIDDVVAGSCLREEAKRRLSEGFAAAGIEYDEELQGMKCQDLGIPVALAARMVEEEGLFIPKHLLILMDQATSLVKDIAALASDQVEFEKVQPFSEIPWPSLDAPPSRIRINSAGRVDTFIGRTGFSDLRKQFLSLMEKTSPSKILEYDGVIGSGKSYNSLMLTVRLIHEFTTNNGSSTMKPNRLVYLFGFDEAAELLFKLQKALLVAFWDNLVMQRKISALDSLDSLTAFVRTARVDNNLYFIVDDWDQLDPASVTYLKAFTEDGPSLRCGSSRQFTALRQTTPHYNRIHRGQYTGFEENELKEYLNYRKSSDISTIYGFDRDANKFPLFVSLWIDCLEAADGKEYEGRKLFSNHREIVAIEIGVRDAVLAISGHDANRKKAELESLYSIAMNNLDQADLNYVLDPKWLALRPSKFFTRFGMPSDRLGDSLKKWIQECEEGH